jgi:hypothetical protein
MLFSPAVFEFGAVHLFAGRPGISGGHDSVVFVNYYRPEVASQAGALVCAPLREIKKILVPVGSHSRKYDLPRY